jgi:hypothetical protein
MADYYALISDAIVDKKTSESRREFYDRARAILADKLRKADPPLSEAIIEQERLALDDAIGKAEGDAVGSEGTLSVPNDLQTQSEHTEEHIRSAALDPARAQLDANVQTRRERRFAFWGFLFVYAFWIGDLFYERPNVLRLVRLAEAWRCYLFRGTDNPFVFHHARELVGRARRTSVHRLRSNNSCQHRPCERCPTLRIWMRRLCDGDPKFPSYYALAGDASWFYSCCVLGDSHVGVYSRV